MLYSHSLLQHRSCTRRMKSNSLLLPLLLLLLLLLLGHGGESCRAPLPKSPPLGGEREKAMTAIFASASRGLLIALRGGGGGSNKGTFIARNVKNSNDKPSSARARSRLFPKWFKGGATEREKVLALWLLAWNAIAATDAFFYTFRPEQTLDNYLTEGWGRHALAQSRMLANCQWALILTSALVAWTGSEPTLKLAFRIMILATLGAFRAVGAGVVEGTIKQPWKSEYTAAMSLPPLLLLSYFAFVY